ncbi:MAG: acyl carrier protein [Pseudonocardiaceae bacterium]
MTTSKASDVMLRELSGMLREVLGEYELGADSEITAATTFFGDLELESIDLVVLAGHLEARYGSRVNIAEFIATLELDEIIGLTVGRLVDYVLDCLRTTSGSTQP